MSFSEELHEECGVFGIYGDADIDPARAVYLGLYALQHRGQQSCGIAVSDMGVIDYHKDLGLVGEVFNEDNLSKLKGQIAMGHVRYTNAGEAGVENSQPIVLRYAKGRLAIAQNGAIVNAKEIRESLAESGAMFQTNSDCELLAQVIAKHRTKTNSIEEAIVSAMPTIKGAYCMLLMSPRKLVAARDPLGMRPLVIGKLHNSFIVASETCALDAVGAQFIRDVEPGEVVVIDGWGIHSIKTNCPNNLCKRKLCIFEYIYFARPDSVIDGVEVHSSRMKAGELLAKQHPVDADIVIPVPDSGIDAALGYAKESGIQYGVGFVRNNYVGRTFIKPKQSQRRQSIDIKLTAMSQAVKGKRVIMVDDSIVRGSTSANIIRLLKAAGATEVHVRISSPTIHWPCYYGTDIPTREELTSNHNTVDQLCKLIGADSLGFLDKDSLGELVNAPEGCKCYCDACFTGDYPIANNED